MTMEKQLETPMKALNFILGGRAAFTLRSRKTGAHIAYRVRKSKDGKVYFASARKSAEGEAGYNYIGLLKPRFNELGADIRKTPKAKPLPVAFEALGWTLHHLARQTMPDDLEIWHEGKCCRCGRALTDPESVHLGIGPECRKKWKFGSKTT